MNFYKVETISGQMNYKVQYFNEVDVPIYCIVSPETFKVTLLK